MVIVYYSEHCGPCHACMDWLKGEGVEFEAVPALEAKKQGVPIFGVPTIDVNGTIVRGFNRELLKRALRGDD